MFSSATALALFSTGSFIVVYNKLPRNVRRFLEKHSLMTDMMALVAVYWLFGGTLTALMAGALCGLMISGLLHITNNKERYLYLWDLKELIKRKLNEANSALVEYGKKYNTHKELTENSQ